MTNGEEKLHIILLKLYTIDMKPLHYLLLLPVLCTAQLKEYCFTGNEIDSLYKIGKEWEFYTREYPRLLSNIDELTQIIQERDNSLQVYITKQDSLDAELLRLTGEKEALAVKLTMQKYDIAETWLGRAWDWIRPRLIWFGIGAGVGAGIVTLNN